MAEPVYTTADDVRTVLGVSEDAFDDDAAEALILTAEDITDDLLGAWTIDDASGRKIVEADVDDWQFEKLGRFVAQLTAKLYLNPSLVNGVQWTSESGPDFSHSGPVGSPVGAGLMSILNQTGLRRLTSGSVGRRQPAWYGFQRNVTDLD